MTINHLTNKIIQVCFLLLFAIVPLLLTPINFELFEFNKMLAVYALTTVITGSWLIKIVSERQIRIRKTPLNIPLLLFLGSQLVSALYSIDRHVSWFGYYSRFNGGMWSLICYGILYFAFVSNFQEIVPALRQKTKNETPENSMATIPMTYFLRIILITAAIVSLYAIAERLGIDKGIWVQDVQNRVFSTLGQPNWLAAYIVALIPVSLALGLTLTDLKPASPDASLGGHRLKNYIYLVLTLIFFLVLLFTRSRSGLLGVAGASIIFWGLSFWLAKDRKKLFKPFILLNLAFIVIIFINGSNIPQIDKYFSLGAVVAKFQKPVPVTKSPTSNNANIYVAPALETGGTESGTIRKYVWQAAITAWNHDWKNRLIGTGTETFAFTFYQYRPAAHNLTSEWDFLYNKAHNEYLNYLATTGIIGLGTYVIFLLAFVWWFIRHNLKDSDNQLIMYGLFAGWVTILVTNFFGFSVVALQVLLFLIPALAIVLKDKDQNYRVIALPSKIKLNLTSGAFIIVPIIIIEMLIVNYWYADTLFAKGHRYALAGYYTHAQSPLMTAAKLNPIEPLYRDELSTTLASLTTSAVQQQNATAAAALASQALKESDSVLTVSPNNVNYWKSRTKIFYSFAAFDPQFLPAAVTALTKAWELSPNDPKIVYNLAILAGRQNNNAEAISLLQKAIAMKKNYRDAYWALYLFYNEEKKTDLGLSVLKDYLTNVDPNDAEFKGIVKL